MGRCWAGVVNLQQKMVAVTSAVRLGDFRPVSRSVLSKPFDRGLFNLDSFLYPEWLFSASAMKYEVALNFDSQRSNIQEVSNLEEGSKDASRKTSVRSS